MIRHWYWILKLNNIHSWNFNKSESITFLLCEIYKLYLNIKYICILKIFIYLIFNLEEYILWTI